MLRLRTLGIALLMAMTSACGAEGAEVRVFAAASLTDALQEIAANYSNETGEHLTFNFGASSMLARQIERGAPADLFISADEAKMEELAHARLIVPATRRTLVSNRLAIIVPSSDRVVMRSPRELASDRYRSIAIGDPAAVPAGIYAHEYLRRIVVWDRVASRIVPTENVRGTLAAVAAGNADAGIVYVTDARSSRRVRIVYEVPPSDAPAISYPAAVLAHAEQPAAARRFLDYLQTPAARAVFERHGFIIPR